MKTVLSILGAVILAVIALPAMALFGYSFFIFLYQYWWAVFSIAGVYGYIAYLAMTYQHRMNIRKENIRYFFDQKKTVYFDIYRKYQDKNIWDVNAWEHDFQSKLRIMRLALIWATGAVCVGLLACLTIYIAMPPYQTKLDMNTIGLAAIALVCAVVVISAYSTFFSAYRYFANQDEDLDRNWRRDHLGHWYAQDGKTYECEWDIPLEINVNGKSVRNPERDQFEWRRDFLAEQKALIAKHQKEGGL